MDEGVSIVFSPVQLAAVLGGQTLSEQSGAGNRFWAGIQVLGGAIELVGAAALILTPEPTMVTKVGGGALAVHGSDTVSTGLAQLWSGRRQTTLTARAAEAAALSLGVDPRTAGTVGAVVDISVPLLAGFAGAARIAAIRGGRISLVAEEAAGGHTIARHVGRTEAQLRDRLLAQQGIPAASSFKTMADAERVISQALRVNSRTIQNWAATAKPGARHAFDYDAAQTIGYGVTRATGQLSDMSKIRVVLEKVGAGDKIYFVLTGFPETMSVTATADDYPDLKALLGGWFHQDFDLAGETLEEIVGACRQTLSDAEAARAASDIARFSSAHRDDLDAAFQSVFSPDVTPAGWGLSTRAWLGRIATLLSEPPR